SAALALFLRDGYARTSVDAVAREAGVSKRTVHDLYGDPQRLLLDVIPRTQAGPEDHFRALLDATLPAEAPDLEAALVAFGHAFASGVAQTPDRNAMVRLLVAEAVHFPELLELWRAAGAEQRGPAERPAGAARRRG